MHQPLPRPLRDQVAGWTLQGDCLSLHVLLSLLLPPQSCFCCPPGNGLARCTCFVYLQRGVGGGSDMIGMFLLHITLRKK